MEENRISIQSDWQLVEDIAKRVYRNKIKVLTQSDIKKIEESIENGTPLFMKNSGAGEMNLDTSIIFNSVSIGFAAIQVVITYLAWKYPSTKNEPNNDGPDNDGPDNDGPDNATTTHHQVTDYKEINQSQIQEIINNIIRDPKTSDDVREELEKHGEAISYATSIELKNQ